jgi:hypothetical protein
MIRSDSPFEDLALVELYRDGKTQAPSHVKQALASKGYIKLVRGKYKATAKGATRAARLQPFERSLRLEAEARSRAQATGGMPLRTDAHFTKF